jgi:DNA-binding response OmpR family regulator
VITWRIAIAKNLVKILLVEDNILLSAALTKVLESNRYAIDLASDGQAGLELATMIEYDLILLDIEVPKLDGISLCRQLRSQGYRKPILLLTANDSDAVAVAGFDAGADDYIRKPCAPEVLLARMRTLLRRSDAFESAISKASSPDGSARDSATTITWGSLCLDLTAGRVICGEQLITLTATEYNLLELFLRNPDRIFSRSAILDRLWGFDNAPTDRAVNTHIKDIRKKLKAGGLTEEIIETIYGMGYRLKSIPQPASSNSNKSETSSETSLEKNLEKSEKSLEKNHARNQKHQTGDESAIAKLLERFQDVFEQQVAVLEQAKVALLAGSLEPEHQQAARQEAHKLAGSLASFGYPEGSKLARSIEHLLASPAEQEIQAERPFTPEDITRLSQLVAALQQELTKTPVESATLPVALSQTCRVLVIDDDATLTEQLKAKADAWGFRIEVAPNPAIARLRLTPIPDVVLLDLSFTATEEDGLSLLRELTQRLPALPIIVFTGRDSLADRLAVSRLGARQFLHKPATTDQIFRAIARVSNQPPAREAKVLMVDDDPAMLAILSKMLTPWGLEVVTLSEPQHFWNVLVATNPNLILLDLEMPQVSGLELCQVVRQDAEWEDLPILVVTAHTDAAWLQQAFAAGADDFITKPVLGPELVTRVLSRIERTRLHSRLGSGDNKGRKQ